MGEVEWPENLDALSDQELDTLERRIANKYMRIVPWGAVVWGFSNCLVFIALFPLVLLDIVPLWLAFPIATLNVLLGYLPSHEAQHNIIAGRGKPLRWLNELLGHVSTIPMVYPYRVLRATHMEHHAHTNDPELDPDYDTSAQSTGHFIYKTVRSWLVATKRDGAYRAALERTGNGHLLMDALAYQAVYLIVLFTMAWTGHAIEAALLWWIPKQLGTAYLSYYLSWAPHHPAKDTSRYGDTRAFRSRLGNVVSMGMQYHIVHHLYPRIPLSLTPAAYRELRPILEKRGCELGGL